ncbi:phytanoyl-CoA dioxygenase family protein [Paraburkholderia sp. A3BS-1L]|uniref:phytanoyl-CoA dioxygenase family protein n=1 Tax=Paraburkholderia sp. A3BS-1L TaxID=3028375 RepID=UPI003DAA31E0
MSFTPLDIKTLPTVPRDTETAEILSKLEQFGGVVIKDYLTRSQLENINAELDEPLASLYEGSKHDSEVVQDFHGSKTKRLTNLATLSPTYRELLDDDVMHRVGDALYSEESGTWWLTTGQLIEIGPGNKAQPLHRDLGNWPVFLEMGKRSPTAITNLMIALTPFTEENGATRIIPGSNHWDEDYGDNIHKGEPAMTIPAEMSAGDALLLSGKVLHGGGANVTSNERRRGLTMPMQPGYLTPEEAYPFLISMDIVKTLSARAQRIIGFRSVYPAGGSPGLWQNNYEELANHLGL